MGALAPITILRSGGETSGEILGFILVAALAAARPGSSREAANGFNGPNDQYGLR